MKTKFSGILTLFLAFVVQLTFAQEKTISGVVSDESSLPLPTATVLVKGTATGTSTDFDGNYSITANTGDVLVFSYVGYADQEVAVGAESTISVSLQLDAQLDEVVVVAFGQTRKPDEVTTAFEKVSGDEILAANNPNAVQSLAGKVSGLQINTTTSGVNPNTEIRLRGERSLSGSNAALVVIDGVISTATTMSNLDPTSIQDVTVLKGPNGAALYGSRGGNGVIVVTTKTGSGNKGKVEVSVTSSVTLETIQYLAELQDRYGKGYWGEIDAFDQGSWGPEYDGTVQPVGLPYPTINDFGSYTYEFRKDNIKPFFNTGVQTQNTVTVSSGDKDGSFSITANRQNTDGLIPDDNRRKDFFSFNSSKNSGKWSFKGIARYTGAVSKTSNGAYAALADAPSDVIVEDFSSGSNSDHWTAFGNSPYWVKDNQRTYGKSSLFDLTGEVSYQINDNISALLRSNLRASNNDGHTYVNDYNADYTVTGDSRNIVSNLSVTNGNSRVLYTDLLTSYNYDLTENIGFNGLAGLNISEVNSFSQTTSGDILTLPGLYTVENISSGIDVSDFSTKGRSMAVFASAEFSYKNYLFLNLTARQEWDSRLQSPGRKLGDTGFFYPSASASFIATKAIPSLKGKVLHKAKVSGGYVKVGNISALGRHDLYDTGFQPNGFPFTSTGVNTFLVPSSTTDANIEPEFVSTFEGNMNLEFFNKNGKPRVTLDGSASWYTNDNQILGASVSPSTGVTTGTINVGRTTSTALELDLGLTPIKTENFEWNLNLGYSTYETTVEKVTDDSKEISLGGGIYAIEGEQFPVIQGSYYNRDDQGRVILDADGSPQVGSGIKVIGQLTPDYILNFGTSVQYKGFKLSATADFRTGHQFYSNVYRSLSLQGRTFATAENGRGHFIFPNSTVDGSGVTNTNVLTGPSYSGPSAYAQYQDFIQSSDYGGVNENFVLDATAFKLREVSLSYALPNNYLKNTFLSAVNIGLSGRNLLTVLPKENRGYSDPEIGGGVDGYSATPATKFYTMSVNVKF